MLEECCSDSSGRIGVLTRAGCNTTARMVRLPHVTAAVIGLVGECACPYQEALTSTPSSPADQRQFAKISDDRGLMRLWMLEGIDQHRPVLNICTPSSSHLAELFAWSGFRADRTQTKTYIFHKIMLNHFTLYKKWYSRQATAQIRQL